MELPKLRGKKENAKKMATFNTHDILVIKYDPDKCKESAPKRELKTDDICFLVKAKTQKNITGMYAYSSGFIKTVTYENIESASHTIQIFLQEGVPVNCNSTSFTYLTRLSTIISKKITLSELPLIREKVFQKLSAQDITKDY